MSANIKTAGKYVKLAKKRDDLESDLKTVKAQMKDLEEELLAYFQANGLKNLRVEDRTLGTRREVWASLKDTAEGVKALRDGGFGDLITENANHQRLSAWVREQLEKVEKEEGEALDTSVNLADRLLLPEPVKAQLNVTEKWTLRVTK